LGQWGRERWFRHWVKPLEQKVLERAWRWAWALERLLVA
jgi:hypothetical protein